MKFTCKIHNINQIRHVALDWPNSNKSRLYNVITNPPIYTVRVYDVLYQSWLLSPPCMTHLYVQKRIMFYYLHCQWHITETNRYTKQLYTSKFRELWSPLGNKFDLEVGQRSPSRSQHGTIGKVLSQRTHMPSIKALPVMVQKLWPRLKFLWQTDRQTDRRTDEWDLMSPRFRESGGQKTLLKDTLGDFPLELEYSRVAVPLTSTSSSVQTFILNNQSFPSFQNYDMREYIIVVTKVSHGPTWVRLWWGSKFKLRNYSCYLPCSVGTRASNCTYYSTKGSYSLKNCNSTETKAE